MSEKENKHTLLKVVGAAAVAGTAAYAGFGYYVFRNVFDLENSTLYTEEKGLRTAAKPEGEKGEWLVHSERSDEFIDSFDGLKLHAVRLMNHPDSNKWLILSHGLGGYSGTMMDYMYEADHRGFNVLAIDHRGCGMSEGRYTGLGWPEHYDLISWINHLVSLDETAEIALFGMGMGASAVMNAAGEYLPANVKCAVEDGGYAGIREMVMAGIRKWCKVEGKPFMPGIDFYVKQCLHFSLNDASTKHHLKQCAVPMLFVHGADDEIVSAGNAFDCYYACSNKKELYIVEGAGFGDKSGEEGYFERVFGFIAGRMN